MNAELTISAESITALSESVAASIESIRPEVEAAMAVRYAEIVHSNFGEFGFDRPLAWAPLSAAYAKKVGRAHATLRVTSALESAVKVNTGGADGASVSISNSDVPYATIHQFGSAVGVIGRIGGHTMPARPYFPMDDQGNATPVTENEVRIAAVEAVERLLK